MDRRWRIEINASGYARVIGRIAALILGVGVAFASPAGPPPDVPSPITVAGYLGPAGVPDEKIFIPAPPADGSEQLRADDAIFKVTRKLDGTARWKMAASDVFADPASVLEDFSCAIGKDISKSPAPALSRLMQRSMSDAFLVLGPPKDRYQRPRPFVRLKGPICTQVSPAFARSGSYPSGHAMVGWFYALVLTDLVPDRSSRILARGRAFGESRVVCGVHYVSDVVAGDEAAAGLYAVLQTNAEFRADLDLAKNELAALLKVAPDADPERCSIEDDASTKTPW